MTKRAPTVGEQKAAWSGWAGNDKRRAYLNFTKAERVLSEWDVPLGEVKAIFGSWVVTADGVECLVHPYFIEAKRLNETDWFGHVSEKSWMKGHTHDLQFALDYALEARRQFKNHAKSSFNKLLNAYQYVYAAEATGYLVVEDLSDAIADWACSVWIDRCRVRDSYVMYAYRERSDIYSLNCDFMTYHDRVGGEEWYLWTTEEKERLRHIFNNPTARFTATLGEHGRNEFKVKGSRAGLSVACKELLSLAKTKQPPPFKGVVPLNVQSMNDWMNQCRMDRFLQDRKENNSMVKMFKDGKALALQTDANDERKFTQDFAHALQDYMTSPKFEGQHEIETYLSGYAEICCKMRGYKADVREQRLLTVGDINPTSETLVNVAENGKTQELDAIA